MAEHNDLGKEGEARASQYIVGKGYAIMERNWRFGNDEIDIIAQQGDELVFIEVKTRNSGFYGSPASFVNKAKQGFMIRAANAYVEKKDIDMEVRFDIIGIVLNKEHFSLEHIEGAFQPRW